MYKEQFEMVTSTSEINWYTISINEAMRSLLNKYNIDYKSLQDTVLPLWLNKYIEVGIEKREDVNCYTYKNIKPKSVIRISLCRTAKRNPLIFPI